MATTFTSAREPRTAVSLRLPSALLDTVKQYATEHRLSKTDAFLHFLNKGIESEKRATEDDALARIEQKVSEALRLIQGQQGIANNDKQFVAATTTKPRERVRGTWDYSDDGGLVLTSVDGSEIAVTANDGLLSWNIVTPNVETANTVSIYEMATMCNGLGMTCNAGEQPSYTLTFSSGNDAVTGTDPSEIQMRRGEAVTLPDCPYEGEHLVFEGWLIDGELYEAGGEFVPDAYADMSAEGSWQIREVAVAETLDDYRYTYVQAAGVPLSLFADNTLTLGKSGTGFYAGTWTLDGSGSEAATLSLLNERGETVAARAEGESLVYEQEGFINDWHQPDRGYGSGVFKANLTHRIDLASFVDAYNGEFGTSYDSVTVASGSATFGEQMEG